MDNKIIEVFIPGPAGRLEAKYYKSKKNTSPIALDNPRKFLVLKRCLLEKLG